VSGYQETLLALEETLRDASPPFGRDETEGYRREAAALREAFIHLDDLIVVGIAGGTGVGKSTLINALAGSEITPVSARRPTSEKVVVYRHREVSFASRLSPDILELEDIRHSSEDLKRVVILDLPDCDSIRIDHRRLLRQVLPHTDLLLLTTDPVKYGDRLFYDLYCSSNHADENKVVIFNKTDLLAESYGEGRDEVLGDILEDLEAKLAEREKGEKPTIFPLSAREALEAKKAGREVPAAFAKLERFLGALREKKLRTHVKHRNLDARFKNLKEKIRSRLRHLEASGKAAALEEGTAEAEQELEGAADSLVLGAFTPDFHRKIAKVLTARAMRTWSVPARLAGRLLRLSAVRHIPESSLLAERIKTFRHRTERRVNGLKKLFSRKWRLPFEAEIPPSSVAWSLSGKLDDLAEDTGPRRFYLTTLGGTALLLFFLVRPSILEGLKAARAGESFLSVLSTVLYSSLETLLWFLNPIYLLLFLAVLAALYVASVFLYVVRLQAEAEKQASLLADSLAEELKETIRKGLQPFKEANERIRRRISELLELTD